MAVRTEVMANVVVGGKPDAQKIGGFPLPQFFMQYCLLSEKADDLVAERACSQGLKIGTRDRIRILPGDAMGKYFSETMPVIFTDTIVPIESP
jgi:hypothetical protein